MRVCSRCSSFPRSVRKVERTLVKFARAAPQRIAAPQCYSTAFNVHQSGWSGWQDDKKNRSRAHCSHVHLLNTWCHTLHCAPLRCVVHRSVHKCLRLWCRCVACMTCRACTLSISCAGRVGTLTEIQTQLTTQFVSTCEVRNQSVSDVTLTQLAR